MTEGIPQNLGKKTLLFFIFRRSGVFLFPLFLTALIFFADFFIDPVSLSPFIIYFNLAILFGFILSFLSFFLVFIIARLEYTSFKIMINPNAFRITRGILTKQEISLPYRRIESVDIRQPLMYQLFGVSRLTIETATDSEETSDVKSDSSDEVLPAVDSKLALEIQKELTSRANVQKFSNQVVPAAKALVAGAGV